MFFIHSLSEVCKSLFIQPTPQEEQKAAATIQKIFRGYRERKKVAPWFSANLLPDGNALRIQVKDYLAKQTEESLNQIPKASAGKTPVYFPPEFPHIILKRSGHKCLERFQKMIFGRDICHQIQATSLVIPKVRLESPGAKSWLEDMRYSYLIEERLPLGSVQLFEQQQFYLAHLQEATAAVREFTHFVLRTGVDDLTIEWKLFTQGKYDLRPRYDNFPFFMDNGAVKIGLIDLEHVKLEDAKPDLSLLEKLLHMYPYHSQEILEVARGYFSESELKDMDQYTEEGKRYLKVSCTDLLDYLKTPKTSIQLEEYARKQIIDELQEEEVLNPRECKIVDQLLTALVDHFNRIMQQVEKVGSHYYFQPYNSFDANTWGNYCALADRLWFNFSPIVTRGKTDLDPGYLDRRGLKEYLIQKLIDHKVIYRYVICGDYGTLIA